MISNSVFKFAFLLYCLCCLKGYADRSFVFVIASYNNENYVEENLKSVFLQNYDDFRIIYINDASTDSTLERVLDMISEYNFSDRAIIIDRGSRCGGLENHYYAISEHVNPNEIVVMLDGDDMILGKNVLKYLNTVYSKKKDSVWFTFGQFIHSSNNAMGFCEEYDEEVVELNQFREEETLPSHLKTFYAWLFMKININDLKYKDEFYPMTGDLAIVLPLLEMAAYNYKFIDRPLYIYNDENPLNDHKVNAILQHQISKYIRALPKYKPLTAFETPEDYRRKQQ